jgi:hypothetical protein
MWIHSLTQSHGCGGRREAEPSATRHGAFGDGFHGAGMVELRTWVQFILMGQGVLVKTAIAN